MIQTKLCTYLLLCKRILFLAYLFGYDLLYLYIWNVFDPHRANIVKMKIKRSGILFIKLAQWASQFDILPSSYRKTFLELQTDCSYHSIEHTLSRLPYDVVQNIILNYTPIASGSIGQVYKCLYKGKECVLKIKHPIESDVLIDIKILKMIAWYVPNIDVIDVHTFIKSINDQQNFLKEVENLKTIQNNFKTFPPGIISIPEVVMHGEEYILETYLEGIEMSKLPSNELKKYREMIALVYLKMMYVDMFIHGDLHSGNIIITKSGQIGLIDYGLCEKIEKMDIDLISELVQCFVDQSKERVILCLLKMGGSTKAMESIAFKNILNELIVKDITNRDLNSNIFSKIPLIASLLKLAVDNESPLKSRILYLLMNYSIIVPNGESHFKTAICKIISNWELMKHYGYAIQPLIDYYQVYDG